MLATSSVGACTFTNAAFMHVDLRTGSCASWRTPDYSMPRPTLHPLTIDARPRKTLVDTDPKGLLNLPLHFHSRTEFHNTLGRDAEIIGRADRVANHERVEPLLEGG